MQYMNEKPMLQCYGGDERFCGWKEDIPEMSTRGTTWKLKLEFLYL